ncbi:ribosomal protein MRPL35 [Trichoderma parareesei]|uniref:Large ribosomal subunit protein mL38 n=1 Tax=Trichoderma parareesei TaxID=858221 RepID=A0A2H2ZPW5_TRIPA|nr:ribosomal protein MRPL35 [Trichoderma parareesei]
MSRCQAVARPLARQLRQQCSIRPFTSGAARAAEVQQQQQTSSSSSQQPSPLDLDPNSVLPEFEAPLIKAGKMPVGSRRRRVALRTTASIPFEQLPYQAFQEARAILAADRQEKVAKIREQLDKIAALEAKDAAQVKGGEKMKETKLASLRRSVEELKILADINDPLVKKRFEDGLGDMNKPIYRHYAERKWRSYDYRLIAQRIKQFNIVPDVLPKLDPLADVQLFFRQQKIAPGAVVNSLVSENPPRLRVQVFDAGSRLVSLVVLDADVPDAENDAFSKRCHFLAANIPLSPNDTSLPLSRIKADDQLAVPWLPPTSQKGAPYHRLGIFLLQQKPGVELDVAALKQLYAARDGFSLKSFRDKFQLTPVGFNMFRSVWDENTAAVMARHGIPGADVEFRPARVHSLKPPVKPKGWEAKRQGPAYRHLWKYTKRIKGLSNARGWTKRR